MGGRRVSRRATLALAPSLALLLGLGAPPASSAQPAAPDPACQSLPAGEGAGLRTEALGLRLDLRPQPWPIPLGRPFAVELRLVGTQAALAPELQLLALDADMPLHRHGMNYRAMLTPIAQPPDRSAAPPSSRSGAAANIQAYRAEGLLFHMPGRWRFIADLVRAGPSGAPPQRLQLRCTVELP